MRLIIWKGHPGSWMWLIEDDDRLLCDIGWAASWGEALAVGLAALDEQRFATRATS